MYLGATELDLPAGASLGPSSAPLTINAVGSLISEVEGAVHGYLAAAGYVVPVSTAATYAWAQIRGAVRNGVMGQVLNTFFPNQGSPADKATTLASSYAAAYQAFITAIKNGDVLLVGASKEGEADGRALPRSGGLASSRTTWCTQF